MSTPLKRQHNHISLLSDKSVQKRQKTMQRNHITRRSRSGVKNRCLYEAVDERVEDLFVKRQDAKERKSCWMAG